MADTDLIEDLRGIAKELDAGWHIAAVKVVGAIQTIESLTAQRDRAIAVLRELVVCEDLPLVRSQANRERDAVAWQSARALLADATVNPEGTK